jgi:hypothetical protein
MDFINKANLDNYYYFIGLVKSYNNLKNIQNENLNTVELRLIQYAKYVKESINHFIDMTYNMEQITLFYLKLLYGELKNIIDFKNNKIIDIDNKENITMFEIYFKIVLYTILKEDTSDKDPRFIITDAEKIFIENPISFGENPTDFGENPADFIENPADFIENPADFIENPADFIENPADFIENPISYFENPISYFENPEKISYFEISDLYNCFYGPMSSNKKKFTKIVPKRSAKKSVKNSHKRSAKKSIKKYSKY